MSEYYHGQVLVHEAVNHKRLNKNSLNMMGKICVDSILFSDLMAHTEFVALCCSSVAGNPPFRLPA